MGFVILGTYSNGGRIFSGLCQRDGRLCFWSDDIAPTYQTKAEAQAACGRFMGSGGSYSVVALDMPPSSSDQQRVKELEAQVQSLKQEVFYLKAPAPQSSEGRVKDLEGKCAEQARLIQRNRDLFKRNDQLRDQLESARLALREFR